MLLAEVSPFLHQHPEHDYTLSKYAPGKEQLCEFHASRTIPFVWDALAQHMGLARCLRMTMKTMIEQQCSPMYSGRA
eukprot:345601-Amphidinium_carterae.1